MQLREAINHLLDLVKKKQGNLQSIHVILLLDIEIFTTLTAKSYS